MSEYLPQMLGSDKITSEEKIILKNFQSRAAVRLQQIFDSKRHSDRFICTIRGSIREASRVSSDEGVSTFETLFHDALKDIQVDKATLKKDGDLITALYICILDMLKAKLGNDDFKYPKMSDFMGVKVYGDNFDGASSKEKERLRQSANWMHIFFKMVSVNRKKGLSIQVISKLLEGWDVKYVTGGGSKLETKYRVIIYETEKLHEDGQTDYDSGLSLESKDDRSSDSDDANLYSGSLIGERDYSDLEMLNQVFANELLEDEDEEHAQFRRSCYYNTTSSSTMSPLSSSSSSTLSHSCHGAQTNNYDPPITVMKGSHDGKRIRIEVTNNGFSSLSRSFKSIQDTASSTSLSLSSSSYFHSNSIQSSNNHCHSAPSANTMDEKMFVGHSLEIAKQSSRENTNTTGIVESKMMPIMRSTPKLDEHSKDILEIFYSNARIRIQQIFGSNPHRHRLLLKIRGSNQQDRTDTSYLDGTISTFESLFQDILDDIQ
eukprot:gene27711-36530_t